MVCQQSLASFLIFSFRLGNESMNDVCCEEVALGFQDGYRPLCHSYDEQSNFLEGIHHDQVIRVQDCFSLGDFRLQDDALEHNYLLHGDAPCKEQGYNQSSAYNDPRSNYGDSRLFAYLLRVQSYTHDFLVLHPFFLNGIALFRGSQKNDPQYPVSNNLSRTLRQFSSFVFLSNGIEQMFCFFLSCLNIRQSNITINNNPMWTAK